MKPWYTNVYILLMILISVVAASMAVLVLLLLPQSSEILLFMQRRLVYAKTFAFNTTVEYQGWKQEKDDHGVFQKKQEHVKYDATGSRDNNDVENSKLRQHFTVSVGATDPFLFVGDHIRIGEQDFLNLTSSPGNVGSLHFDTLQKKWLFFNLSKLLENFAWPFGGYRTSSSADRVFLGEQFRVTPFLHLEEKLPSEKINGFSSYHYKVRPELVYAKDYFIMSEQKQLHRELTSKEHNALDTFFANVTAGDGEVWIGKGDYFPYRLQFRFTYKDDMREGIFSVAMNFLHFNESVDIVAPSGGVSDGNLLITSLLPSIKGHLPLAKEGVVPRTEGVVNNNSLPAPILDVGQDDTDHDGLSNMLEAFYGSNLRNPDTDPKQSRTSHYENPERESPANRHTYGLLPRKN